jgi:hypothetical protein
VDTPSITLSSTLLPALCVAFNPCAATIRTSSFVRLSNLRKASSISVLPTSFFKNVSGKMVNPERPSLSKHQLTSFALLNLFCRDGENGKYFDHDFHHNVRHSYGRWNLDINFKSSEAVLDAFEEVDKYVLVGTNSGGCLIETRVSTPNKSHTGNPHRKKDTNSRENHGRGGYCLSGQNVRVILSKSLETYQASAPANGRGQGIQYFHG